MATGFQRFHYNVTDDLGDEAPRSATLRGVRSAGSEEDEVGFSSDEAAARYHLTRLMERDERPALRGVSAPSRAELVPDLNLVDVQDLPRANRLVRFEQAHRDIPVFGSRAVCELNSERGMVAAQGSVAEVEDVPTVPTVSVAEAISSITRFTGCDPSALQDVSSPKLSFFLHQKTGRWHLVYVFTKVPAAPAKLAEEARGHGLARSPRMLSPLVTYLVDANDGSIVYYFSATPMVTVPTRCKGVDELGQMVEVWGCAVGSEFELRDPHFDVVTYDLRMADIEDPPPVLTDATRNAASDWGEVNKAAISAHANASRISRFLKSVLARDGIDNKGMELVNVVNCTYGRDEPPPAWRNAVWYDDRMWYGQAQGEDGSLVSFSRFLDVIAHELTHGLTERTAGLVYRDESGALNESFSDIFGIIVKNWDSTREEGDGGDVEDWDWELGTGLGENGLPLRDLSEPSRTGDPAHYSEGDTGERDAGGVHINSNIHNKAAYNVLTATDESGSRYFTPNDVAVMYYYCLLSLNATATFQEALAALLDVAATVYAGDPPDRKAKRVQAIREAYAAVGIEE